MERRLFLEQMTRRVWVLESDDAISGPMNGDGPEIGMAKGSERGGHAAGHKTERRAVGAGGMLQCSLRRFLTVSGTATWVVAADERPADRFVRVNGRLWTFDADRPRVKPAPSVVRRPQEAAASFFRPSSGMGYAAVARGIPVEMTVPAAPTRDFSQDMDVEMCAAPQATQPSGLEAVNAQLAEEL
eukprot:TRINITY_DN25451_c0_g1_i2.p1 TRINITY_DN25451_c0_g1~~TRINITY_DN25451_c0_g1_i2.p1  ORF type:complete len:186 (+),score=15.23 TRINITY_DN25451_c0_g1_i2:229-786(+)